MGRGDERKSGKGGNPPECEHGFHNVNGSKLAPGGAIFSER